MASFSRSPVMSKKIAIAPAIPSSGLWISAALTWRRIGAVVPSVELFVPDPLPRSAKTGHFSGSGRPSRSRSDRRPRRPMGAPLIDRPRILGFRIRDGHGPRRMSTRITPAGIFRITVSRRRRSIAACIRDASARSAAAPRRRPGRRAAARGRSEDRSNAAANARRGWPCSHGPDRARQRADQQRHAEDGREHGCDPPTRVAVAHRGRRVVVGRRISLLGSGVHSRPAAGHALSAHSPCQWGGGRDQ